MISYDKFRQQLYRIFSQDPSLNIIPLEDILGAIPTVDQLDDVSEGSVVLVRTDLDMPIKDSKVEDLSRIEATSATIKYCLERGWKTIIFGHLGRDKSSSLLPVCDAMSEEIGQPIRFISDWLDEERLTLLDSVISQVNDAKPGTPFMLENTRKYSIETALWTATQETFPDICNKMYTLASDIKERLTSIEINEAIAASNLDFSSSVLPLVMLKTALGFYISDEMKKHVTGARRANMVVFSGLKINKLDDLEAVAERGNLKLVIAAGSLAMALKKAQAQLAGSDFHLGRAETDEKEKAYIPVKRVEQAKRIFQMFKENGVDLVLPIDFILDNGQVAEQIPPDRVQLDVGPKTRKLIKQKVDEYIAASKKSNEPFVMFYNGVFGKFEDPKYEAGTREFIGHLAEMTREGIITYVGGGEGRLALQKYGALSEATHAFTAGGTILKSLSDRHLQFLKAMYLQNKDR